MIMLSNQHNTAHTHKIHTSFVLLVQSYKTYHTHDMIWSASMVKKKTMLTATQRWPMKMFWWNEMICCLFRASHAKRGEKKTKPIHIDVKIKDALNALFIHHITQCFCCFTNQKRMKYDTYAQLYFIHFFNANISVSLIWLTFSLISVFFLYLFIYSFIYCLIMIRWRYVRVYWGDSYFRLSFSEWCSSIEIPEAGDQ